MTPATPVHHLWLLPEPASHRRLGRAIEVLMARLGSPSFEPHVTLLGSLPGDAADLIERTRRLAQGLAPFPITVERVEHGPQFFRCVYWSAMLDPALAAAHAEAARAFGPNGELAPFCPHLSLVYGTLEPGRRQRLVATARINPPAPFEVDRLQLVAGAPDYRDWRAIGLFPLRGDAAKPDRVTM